MNTISQVYGMENQWESISSQFLTGSNQLAQIPIPSIDYTSAANRKKGKGYYGALFQAVHAGLEKKPIDSEMLRNWRKAILE